MFRFYADEKGLGSEFVAVFTQMQKVEDSEEAKEVLEAPERKVSSWSCLLATLMILLLGDGNMTFYAQYTVRF